MRGGQDEPDSSSVQRRLDRMTARQAVAELLKDSGLKVREQANELVITNPRDPERGRIYVEYGSGYVTHERTILDPFGPLQGYSSPEADEEQVSAEKIFAALGGKPEQPPTTDPGSPSAISGAGQKDHGTDPAPSLDSTDMPEQRNGSQE